MGNGFRQSFLLHVLKRTPRATSANTVAKRIRRAFIRVTTPAATSDNSKRSGKLLAEFSVIRSSRVFGFVNSGATVAAKFLRYSRASLRSSRNRQTSSGCAKRGYLEESNDEDSGRRPHAHLIQKLRESLEIVFAQMEELIPKLPSVQFHKPDLRGRGFPLLTFSGDNRAQFFAVVQVPDYRQPQESKPDRN